MKPQRILLLALVGLVAVLASSSQGLVVPAHATAGALQAVTVPASATDTSKPHLTYSGATITLKGVAAGGGTEFKWDFGDGSAATAWTSISDPENLGVTHSYTGSVGHTFTATLSVRDSSAPGVLASATYPVEIEAGSDLADPAQAKVRATMALDAGLWYLHVEQTRSTLAEGAPGYGQPAGVWKSTVAGDTGGYTQSDTCGAVYAFEQHGSLAGGAAETDPYVADVQRGLNAILANALVVGIQQAGRDGNPDVNGNGIGIRLADDNTFRDGLCAMAVGASGSGSMLAATGPANVEGRSVAAIGQDLVDYFAWAQSFGCPAGQGCSQSGGWWYGANQNGGSGNTNPWPILTLAALRSELGETIPPFVLQRVPDFVNVIHHTATDNDFGGYGFTTSSLWVAISETAGGIIAHILVGDSQLHPDVEHAVAYIYRHWSDTDTAGGIEVNLGDSFTMFLTAEALAAAAPGTGVTRITNYNSSAQPQPTFDGAYTQSGQTQQGYGNYLVSHQAADGSLPDSVDTGTTFASGILGADAGSPSDIFATTAFNARVLEALPLAVGGSVASGPAANIGGPYTGAPNIPVQLDASASTGTGLAYAWDFHNNGLFADATGATPTATFGSAGVYPIALRVTDASGARSTAFTTVTITESKPVANTGGPYSGTVNVPIQLDGSASTGSGLTYAWDFHNNGQFADATGATPTVTFVAPGTYTIGLRVTDGAGRTDTAFTTAAAGARTPVANPGGPYTALAGQTIQLDGSGSSDPDGLFLTYAWDLQSTGLFADSTAVKPNFNVGAAVAPGTSFAVCLKVSNGARTNTACTTVTVVAPQRPPICLIVAPTEVVSNTGRTMTFPVDGSRSYDVNGNALTFSWSTDSGPTFADPIAAATSQARDMAHAGGLVSWTDTLTVDNGFFSSSCQKTITVVDNLPPTFTTKPTNVIFEADANTTTNVNAWLANVAAVDPAAVVSDVLVANDFVPDPGKIGGVGVGTTVTVTWSATNPDDDAVTAQTSATLTVADTTPPTLTLPTDKTVEATGQSGAAVSFTPSASDFVSGSVPVNCTPASGSSFPIGTTTVDCHATDAANNTGTGSFKVTVTDTKAPTMSLPSDIQVNASSASGATVNFTAGATDLADGAVPVNCSPASGTTFPVGTTTVNCSASDGHGNTASGSFKVTVFYDPTPPVITPTISGTSGQNGWYTSNVTISWKVSDPESAISTSSGCDDATGTTDTTTSGVTYTCTATSLGGTSSRSVTIKRDATPPNLSCGHADTLWHAVNISIGCTASDDASGLAFSTDASFSLTTTVPTNSETATASTDSHKVCDVAGHCVTAGPINGNMIDGKAPTITCNAALFALNQSPANVTAVASDGGSGPASQNLSAAANTSTVGLRSITFIGIDTVGNSAPKSCSYAVGYGFGGFMSPLPKSTLQKSGSTIPVKFVLTDASGQPIAAAFAAALAGANNVEATLAGPNIPPQTALCSWNSFFLYFQCNIKTPAGVKTGASNPYTITASENLGAGFVTAPPVGTAVNPETIYFK